MRRTRDHLGCRSPTNEATYSVKGTVPQNLPQELVRTSSGLKELAHK